MPTEHFKSNEAYRKWTAYRHIHGIAAPNLKTAVIAGKPHKVHHSEGESMKRAPYHHTVITHHHDGSHTVEHHPHVGAAKGSAAFMDRGEPKTYSVADHEGLMDKLDEHLGGDGAAMAHAGKAEAAVASDDEG